ENFIATAVVPTYPFDLVSANALAGWSIRALRASKIAATIYTVRRDSDNTTLAVAAALPAGEGDFSAVAAFVGAPNTQACATTLGLDTIVVTDASALFVNEYVTGAGIPANTYILDLSAAPTVQISNAATATAAAANLTFTP